MATPNAPGLPPPSPERRRVAVGQFEHANQAARQGQFDYALRMLCTCCALDPANLVYRQALRRTAKAKYRNNLRGGWLAWLTTWPVRARLKAALRTRDFLKAMELAEHVLAHNPWDLGAQKDLSAAAEELGLLDVAAWALEQARPRQPGDAGLNRALARLYERRGDFTQAMVLWQVVNKLRPDDHEATHKLKDLAVADTLTRGNYQGALASDKDRSDADIRAADALEPSPHTPGPRLDETPLPQGRVGRDAAPLRARLQDDPTNASLYRQLAALYRRAGELDQARSVLEEGLGPTGNAFELTAELADLDIEPFRVNLAVAEERCKDRPDDEDLRRLRLRLRKEVNTRELDLYRQKADRCPLELGWRYEVGVRLLRGGQIDEAIQEFQAARADARYRWQALLHLGHCFKARNNWPLAGRNFEEALQLLPPAGETARRKELLFLLAQGSAEAGDLLRAVEWGQELANLDFAYRDIGRLLDRWNHDLQESSHGAHG
jgi:tetratricopeptide (TPR) repeat protein